MRRVAIVSAVRTGIGKYAGQWVATPSEKLAAAAIREAVERAGLAAAAVLVPAIYM